MRNDIAKEQEEKDEKKKTPKKVITRTSIEQEEKAKPGWNSLKYVETYVKQLERDYNRAKKRAEKGILCIKMDIYEKRVKSLNLAIAERMQNNKSHGTESIIYSIKESEDEEDDQESRSVMSDMTLRTTNSYKSIVSPEKHSIVKKGQQSSNTNNRPVLESLGKTRKSGSNQIEKENNSSEGDLKKDKPIEITQDERSVCSEMTLETKVKDINENERNEDQRITLGLI